MLAVLKTGAAYLPIDPAHASARMEFVLADAAPTAVITTAELRSRLDKSDLPVIDVHDPPSRPNPAPHFHIPPPKMSPTSSTPPVPPEHPRA